MTNTVQKENSQKEKLSLFDYAMEFMGWLQIVASPLFGGLIVGGIVYLLIGNTAGLVLGILIAIIGLTIGVIIANRVWKKKGTINLMSRVNASPELDYLDQVPDQDRRHTT